MNLQQKIRDNEEYDQLVKSLHDLKEIQDNMAQLLFSQEEKIDSVEENMMHSSQNLDLAVDELKEAKRLKFRYYPLLLGGLVGGVLGGPVGFLVGLKYTSLTAGAGTLLGGAGGYFIQ